MSGDHGALDDGNNCCNVADVRRPELEAKLAELGYSYIGISADPRYRTWRREAKGRREARTVHVPNTDLIMNHVAERILADAER